MFLSHKVKCKMEPTSKLTCYLASSQITGAFETNSVMTLTRGGFCVLFALKLLIQTALGDILKVNALCNR